MASDKESLLKLISESIINEEMAVKMYTELMEQSKDETIKEFIDAEKQHVLLLEEIKTSIQQI